MEYKVIDELFLHELVNKVNDHITSGWKLQGGISVVRALRTGDRDQLRYYQALVKEKS